ncbi:MAG: cytochrome o ubiquinol oxidase subunit IV [Pseudoxanthomonas sp.]|nr:cytochrome o ubiquinol oxidase subunit IV [Pseudoxanthomonas sp.]
MSTEHETGHHGDSHDGHEDHSEASHGTVGGYVTGFLLSVVLTAIPFWLVMSGGVSSSGATALILTAFAVVQIVVHMVYFLHMNTKSESGWTMLALIFTLVLVVIVLAGSLWVMYHLNTRMMPMPNEMLNMP